MKRASNYSTKTPRRERVKDLICAAVAVTCLALCAWFHFHTPQVSPVWTDSYPMANAGMQWAYTSDSRCQP